MGKPSPAEHLAPTSFPSMFSQPPPTAAPSMPNNMPMPNNISMPSNMPMPTTMPMPTAMPMPTTMPNNMPMPTNIPTNMPPNIPSNIHPNNPSKTARQEQLIKKLVGMLPGSDEETIKNCIAALRHRHGKLSGWPTSKIASHIAELIKDGGIKE